MEPLVRAECFHTKRTILYVKDKKPHPSGQRQSRLTLWVNVGYACIECGAQKVDMAKMEEVLMAEGSEKFANPQNALLKLIAEKRRSLAGAR